MILSNEERVFLVYLLSSQKTIDTPF